MSLAIAKKKSTKQGATRSEFRYSCPKTMKQRPLWCTKQILWELNLFLMKKLSFVKIKLCERKTLPLFSLNGAWRNIKRAGRGGDITLAGVGVNLVPRVLSYMQREPGNDVELEFRPLRSKRILGDPWAATILVKNLETLSQCWIGYYSGLSTSKYAWLNIGEGEGTLQWEQKYEE